MKLQLFSSVAIVLLSAVPGAFSAEHHLRHVAPANDVEPEVLDETSDFWEKWSKGWGSDWKENAKRGQKIGREYAKHYGYGGYHGSGSNWCENFNRDVCRRNDYNCRWKNGKCRNKSSEDEQEFDSQDLELAEYEE